MDATDPQYALGRPEGQSSTADPVVSRRARAMLFVLATSFAPTTVTRAEPGYELWLRYRLVVNAEQLRESLGAILVDGKSWTLHVAGGELLRGLSAMVGRQRLLTSEMQPNVGLVVGTYEGSATVRSLVRRDDVSGVGDEGFVIRRPLFAGRRVTVIAANSDVGALYGSFALLRGLQMGRSLDALVTASAPRIHRRVLDHWDNLDGTVERGYAGRSLWNWSQLPAVSQRYRDYARANASIGINGTVLTNVNANAKVLTPAYLAKVAALADLFRMYGITVYLTARFSAPIELGGLKTADPLDPAVRAWWKTKVDDIYAAVPDFGGFLVKANSEGQPGPQDYHRTHADGANMLAEALAPHGGFVMWRAFVYSNETPTDRAKQAYDEFVPLDGKFADNVLVQVKNGPVDFQPREPFHPLFGAMPKTPLMMEFQITKEYLGFATHLVYLGTLFEEALEADTRVKGKGSTVAKILDGELQGYRLTGMAGVANIGSDRNWSGSQFDQANWYAFGRFAWNPEASARDIAEDWTRMTFGNDPQLVGPVVDMMMGSREAAVDYMTPLGLAHLMGTGHHYGPAPWVNDLGRADWNPTYYHRADAYGIGFDRGPKGSDAIAQYQKDVAAIFGDRKKVPESLLLWFHHVPWDYKMKSGRSLWDELVIHYSHGVDEVGRMRATWDSLKPFVDTERHAQVAAYLAIQQQEARW